VLKKVQIQFTPINDLIPVTLGDDASKFAMTIEHLGGSCVAQIEPLAGGANPAMFPRGNIGGEFIFRSSKTYASYHITFAQFQTEYSRINQQGTLQKVYLTQMAYSSVTQSAQVLAEEVASLLPGHPKLSSLESLGAISGQTPTDNVSLAAADGDGSVAFGPGKARLVAFFATWLSETSDLKSELTGLNAYAKAAASKHLPELAAVDETVTEPSAAAVTSYLHQVGTLSYPVALDESGRLADGYGAQDQPWLVLVNKAGKIVWQHDGWVSVPELEKAAAAVH